MLVSARLVVLSYLYCTVNKVWGRGSGAGCAAFRVGRVRTYRLQGWLSALLQLCLGRRLCGGPLCCFDARHHRSHNGNTSSYGRSETSRRLGRPCSPEMV